MNHLCREAIHLWGHNAQIEQAKEEFLELVVELQKVFRGRQNEDHILEEMADAYQCLYQLILMYGPEKFQEAMDLKLAKFEKHLVETQYTRDMGFKV